MIIAQPTPCFQSLSQNCCLSSVLPYLSFFPALSHSLASGKFLSFQPSFWYVTILNSIFSLDLCLPDTWPPTLCSPRYLECLDDKFLTIPGSALTTLFLLSAFFSVFLIKRVYDPPSVNHFGSMINTH